MTNTFKDGNNTAMTNPTRNAAGESLREIGAGWDHRAAAPKESGQHQQQ